jgi:catechol 2,3-dioxygenase-like lactoylglutathione lyase family enzyme
VKIDAPWQFAVFSAGNGGKMIDHIGIRVIDLISAARFYDAVLGAIGHGRCYEDENVIGYGSDDHGFFWLHRADTTSAGTHIAIDAPDHRAVEAFHKAGLGAGGRDNGTPGPRPDYGPCYFAAFLLDPAGNNIEAVCNKAGA